MKSGELEEREAEMRFATERELRAKLARMFD